LTNGTELLKQLLDGVDACEFGLWTNGRDVVYAEHLDRGWVAVRPAQQWKGAHIALLISSGHQERAAITFLARAAGRQRAGTFDRQIEVTRLRLVDPPLPLAELAQQLPSRHRTILDPNGILPKRGGEVLLKTLTTVRPGLQEAVDELRQIVQRIRLVGSAGELFAQERDATGLALQIAGYDRGVIGQTSWLSQSAGRVSVPFLDTIEEGAPVIEDQLLNYDAELFAGLLAQRTNHLAWKAFRDEKSLLIIGNVNRFDPEHTLGVDLIYYNMTRQSFVLVQYKKMVVADRDWSYYPASDKRLDEELDRMRLVDDICEKVHQSGDDYRLSVTPCWIKLCKGLATLPEGDSLCPGMYLARAHFEQLRARPETKGSRGGVRFGYKTVPRYLETTDFTKLVQDGWIGSTGTGSGLILEQVEASLNGWRSVVFADYVGEEGTQAERTGKRRGGRTQVGR
jgi:hypothetical protein